MREISIVPIVAILAFWSLPARAQSVSMRISDEGIELRIPGKDPRFFKTIWKISVIVHKCIMDNYSLESV